MATRKKKTEVIESADVSEPKVVKGNHLTVTTYPDGRTELVWDDEALLDEVREAIAGAELADMKPAVRAKVATRKKKEKANGKETN